MAFDALAARSLDASYRAFGKAATYTPPSGPVASCSIIVDRADDVAALGGMSVVAKRRRVEVRKSEVSLPVKGGYFTRGVEVLTIAAAPHCEDPDALVWICLCDPT